MRVVTATDEGAVELNWMWLPTWLGMNAKFKKELEDKFKEKIEGRPLDEGTLDDIHNEVLDFISNKFQVKGLYDYLDGVKFIEL